MATLPPARSSQSRGGGRSGSLAVCRRHTRALCVADTVALQVCGQVNPTSIADKGAEPRTAHVYGPWSQAWQATGPASDPSTFAVNCQLPCRLCSQQSKIKCKPVRLGEEKR